MMTYAHVFPARAIVGRNEQHTIVFTTHGERATRGAAERIACALSEYVVAPVGAGGVEYIRRRLLRADSCEPSAHGGHHVTGEGWGYMGAEVIKA